jgi:hypothetical protein
MTTAAAEATGTGDLLCGGCGYNLRGVPSDRCPECGQQFDPSHLIAALIPWEQRRYVGRVRAFWRTAWMASFRPKELAAKLDWPVNRAAARRFLGWVVVIEIAAIYAAGLSAMRLWPYLWQIPRNKFDPDAWDWLPNGWCAGVMLGAVSLWLALLTPITALFFRRDNLPVERQNRATAISLYTCAPLTWIAAGLLAATTFAWIVWGRDRSSVSPFDAAAVIAQFLCAIAIVVGVSWAMHRRQRLDPRGYSRLGSWAVACVAVALGTAGIVMTWVRFSLFTKVIAPLVAARMGQVGAIILLLPLAWWWLHSVRLMRLCCGTGTARNLAAGVMMLLAWTASLLVIATTAYAAILLGLMIATWGT